MTGRDLIIYILENNLEDSPVFNDGRFLGFITEDEAAAKFYVGINTIRLWVELGYINGVKIGDVLYIPAFENKGEKNAKKDMSINDDSNNVNLNNINVQQYNKNK